MVPNAKMSERWSTFFPRTCSGDMYSTVPITVPDSVPRATVGSEPEEFFASVILARWNSKIITRPWLVRNKISGFWTLLLLLCLVVVAHTWYIMTAVHVLFIRA